MRSENFKSDRFQTSFSSIGGLKPNPKVVQVAHETLVPLDQNVSCPFCLGLSEFRRFLVSNKQGISRSMGKCCLCGQGLYLKSLKMMSETDAAKYAKWVFEYGGFWKKINFNIWKGRLKMMGWTQPFWDEYQKLKGEASEDGNEGFMDYIDRKQREEQEEWTKKEDLNEIRS
jgi:hypothetical protein